MMVGIMVQASSSRCEPRMRGVEPVARARRYFAAIDHESVDQEAATPQTMVTYQNRYSNLTARSRLARG